MSKLNAKMCLLMKTQHLCHLRCQRAHVQIIIIYESFVCFASKGAKIDEAMEKTQSPNEEIVGTYTLPQMHHKLLIQYVCACVRARRDAS